MTSSTPDLLLHEPRLAILHPPHFTNGELVQSILEQPTWIQRDPEIVLFRPQLLQPHFLDQWLAKYYWFNTSFSPVDQEKESWFTGLDEVLSYATHLMVFWDGTPHTVVNQYLRRKERPMPPTKVVTV